MNNNISLIKNGKFEERNLEELNYRYEREYKELLYCFDVKFKESADFGKIKEIKYIFEKEFLFIKENFKILCEKIIDMNIYLDRKFK